MLQTEGDTIFVLCHLRARWRTSS